MNWKEMNEAVDSARITLRNADYAANSISKLMVGRLRNVQDNYQGHETLAALKKELQQYNARTGEWKN